MRSLRIAYTHNLQLSDAPSEAEFDPPEVVAAIAGALRRLGHEVEPIDVSGPVPELVARLVGSAPDLVFNTAEGQLGRCREAFYPALFEQLGLAFTGSDAYTCALTLDKQLTKLVLAQHGVPTPRWAFVARGAALRAAAWRFPVIVKPNFEGSSLGISADSIVEGPEELAARVDQRLAEFPSGVLVEEFVVGDDVATPLLAAASPATGGVLTSVAYCHVDDVIRARKYPIYDYSMKQGGHLEPSLVAPAPLAEATAAEIARLARTSFRVLGVRDLGRIDWRIDREGRPWLLEVNALPSLQPDSSLYLSAALHGLGSMEAVLAAVIESALARRM